MWRSGIHNLSVRRLGDTIELMAQGSKTHPTQNLRCQPAPIMLLAADILQTILWSRGDEFFRVILLREASIPTFFMISAALSIRSPFERNTSWASMGSISVSAIVIRGSSE